MKRWRCESVRFRQMPDWWMSRWRCHVKNYRAERGDESTDAMPASCFGGIPTAPAVMLPR
ncbi:hypothetical protein KCP74_22530 [Salmonella enterica subsp. enterica]|nr:hypothetical protein KCP74_22530 [Salmonella enterica subsp. enterica]